MVGSPRRYEHAPLLPPAGIVQGEKQDLDSQDSLSSLNRSPQPIEEQRRSMSGGSLSCIVSSKSGISKTIDADLHLGGTIDIQGVCKSTIVRGEDDFPSGTMRVTDCHDTTIYALAPMQ